VHIAKVGKMKKTFSIGQMARQAEVGIETVRFYERQGLLSEPARKPSGYREYTDEAVTRLRFIRRAKELGFSLKEIAELIELRFDPNTTCAELKKQAEHKLLDIDSRIRDLNKMKRVLQKLTSTCKGSGSLKGCSILEALDSGKEIRS
jgi:MerR family copper efflux transcriptional regulator